MSSDSEHFPLSSDDSDVEDVEIDEVDEQEAEEELVPIDASEVPALLKGLESTEMDVFITRLLTTDVQSIAKLSHILNHQVDLFHELILPDVPSLFKLAKENDGDEERRRPLVDLLSEIATTSEKGSATIRADLEAFVAFLLYPDLIDRFSVLRALERMLGEDSSLEPDLITILKSHILSLPSQVDAGACGPYRSAIECFQHIVLYQEENLRTAFAKAGAIEFIINTTGAPDPATREVAIQGLEAALTAKDELQEHFARNNPDGDYDDPMHFHGMIVLPAIGLLRDEDDRVVNAALSFLQSDDTELTAAFVCASDDALMSLALCLARKDPEVLGAPVDWLLGRYAEVDLKAVIEGFQKAWAAEDVSVETKIRMLRGVANNFDKTKLAAGRGGMAEFVLRILDDAQHRSALLSTLPKLLEDDRSVGHVLVKKGGIPRLLNIFEQGSSIEERLSGSFNPQPFTSNFMTGASTALSEDDVLPRILSALQSPETNISVAAFNLLAEILKTDDWFDEDIPAPIKERVVNPELADLVISKLKVPELAPSALSVLTEMCWAYKRGFEVVQKAFEPYIPQADAAFFAALYGESAARFISRKRRHVADAAVNAGAFPRMLTLLEEPITSVESCRVTVEAFRTLLCAEVADLAVGRTNTRIPVLLAHLIADGSFASVLQATLMVRLLSDDDNPKALESWADVLANETTVNQLINALNTELVEFERPSADLPMEEFEALGKEYEKKTEAEAERFRKMISGLLPLFKPFSNILAGALLKRSNTCDEACVVELLGKLATSGEDEALLEPLVNAAKELLALPNPPALDKIKTWVGSESGLATAFYLAGILPFLTERAVIPPTEEDEEPDHSVPNEIIDILVYLATNRQRGRLSQARTPADGQGGGSGGKGGKKKKKKGKYTPRISKAGVLLRLTVLSNTSATAKEAVIDAEGVELMSQCLEADVSQYWTQPLQCFKALIESGDTRIHNPAVALLPRIATLWGSESTPESDMPHLLEFLQAFITAYDIQPMLNAEWDLLLVKKLSEEPASVCNMSVLVETVSVLFGSGEAGRKAVLALYARGWMKRLWRANTIGVSRLPGRDIARAILELGALDYAVKLLKSDDIQYVTKGAP
ncbi:armadillo-type protein [Coprinopsis sp. MPI-PUGE-AT-0042]|nr:armadillo-type protein [Coprinopsis sp. MPI-PUGE-AT-0042]